MKIRNLKKILRKRIIFSDEIYIIGHHYIDLDAFGALLGLAAISNKLNKKANLIISDKTLEPGVKKALEKLDVKLNIISDIKNKNLTNSLLLVVDTNKKSLISCLDEIDFFKHIIVIDHHDVNADTIDNALLFINQEYSSTCEIITELIRMFRVKISSYLATIIFSGIVLDTNNFILNADKKTFYNAYYLLDKGASIIEVQYLLKQDLESFITRQKMLTNIKIIHKKIAISTGVQGEIYRRDDLAKIAQTLLLFNGIESSFVIGYLNEKEIGISGRTLGKLNIGKIMSKLDGGGNLTEGATKIASTSIDEVEKKLIAILEK